MQLHLIYNYLIVYLHYNKNDKLKFKEIMKTFRNIFTNTTTVNNTIAVGNIFGFDNKGKNNAWDRTSSGFSNSLGGTEV